MSERNSDNARFRRLRKAGLRRRQQEREVWAAVAQRAASRIHAGSDSEQSGGARGRVGTRHLMAGESATESPARRLSARRHSEGA